MIHDRDSFKLYLEKDRKALGEKRVHPRLLGDEVWKFQRVLRRLEYFTNTGKVLRRTITRFRFHSMSIRLGFSIPINVFGPGLAIVHYGTIVVSKGARIGENCRIHEGVTIGATNGSDKAAIIGNNVFIGTGAKIIGEVRISSNVAVAANAVVTKDIISEHGCTVGGVPARIISMNDSSSNIHLLS
jgi:serine O-acetyltransferase